MGFSVDVGISAFTVFLQGILSFFSPCVLPLLPVYMGYLSGGTAVRGEDGKTRYDRKKVALNTFFFVLGVSFSFFLLGLGMTVVGSFFSTHQLLFSRICGVIIILFGLYQLGIFGKLRPLESEHRLPFRLDKLAASPLTALVMGFTFSFAWTPCVGPSLSTVLLMTASAASKTTGFLLIGVYTLGFVIPFLAAGIFTASLLDFFSRHRDIVSYTVKIGGVCMILIGVIMLAGKMSSITGFFARLGHPSGSESSVSVSEDSAVASESDESESSLSSPAESSAVTLTPAIDFEFPDQYGNVHRLSDYKGKVVFLNFWATWCPPCRAEMPDIQKLYEKYSAESDPEVVILGVACPGYGSEQELDGIKAFLADNGYTYPTLMDPSGEILYAYSINAFPTTFMITRGGNVLGYAAGSLPEEVMQQIIDQTLAQQD